MASRAHLTGASQRSCLTVRPGAADLRARRVITHPPILTRPTWSASAMGSRDARVRASRTRRSRAGTRESRTPRLAGGMAAAVVAFRPGLETAMTIPRVHAAPSPAHLPACRAAELRMWIVAALAAAFWFDVLADAARRGVMSAGDPGFPPGAAGAAGLTAQLAFTCCEALVAGGAWRLLGHAARWRSLAPRLLAVSAAEAFAVALASGQVALPAPLAVVLAGTRAAGGGPAASGAAFAFSTFGLLTLVRLALSADAQARVAQAPPARSLLLVAAFYLATRVALAWGFDLVQGQSFTGAELSP